MPRGGKRPNSGPKKGTVYAKTRAKRRGRERGIQQAEITAERTILELARLAFTDRRGVWSAEGRLKPFTEWTTDQAALLEGFEVIVKNAAAGDGHTDTVHKVHLSRKLGALEVLARYFGLEKSKVEVSGRVTLETLIAGALQPANDLVTGQKK